jgi:hypothetical protein
MKGSQEICRINFPGCIYVCVCLGDGKEFVGSEVSLVMFERYFRMLAIILVLQKSALGFTSAENSAATDRCVSSLIFLTYL